MRLSIFVQAAEGKILYKNDDWEREITSLSTDSRRAQPSALFFCLTGGRVDSHALAEEAVKAGAVAVVTERELPVSVPQLLVSDSRRALGISSSLFYGNPSHSLRVIGVTGTNGKTTTTYMLEAILKASGRKTGIIGTLGIRYGGREKPSDLTTPDPIPLQKTLAEMVACGVEYVVMEVSAHALYYHKTAGVRFCAGIFTNLTQDHLDFFSTMSFYKAAKLRLFTEDCPLAVVNGDEDTGREIEKMRKNTGVKTLTYGLDTPTDAFAVLTDEGLRGTAGVLNINDQLCPMRLSLCGRHNVYNALAAATCAAALGIEVSAIAEGLSSLQGVKGRLERVSEYQGGEIFVDFAHTPDGLAKSLEALREYCTGRLICLFGCGGNRDRTKRPVMGETAATRSDFAVLTSDNPRYEDPLDILSEVERGYRRYSSRYVIVPDRERAIEYALSTLGRGDILLIAGKGGEEYQEIMGIKYPFNDKDIVIKYLQRKGKMSL